MRQLAHFLQDKGMPITPQGIRREHIESFMVALLAQRKASTCATRFRSLQQYFAWLIEDGEIRDSPMANMVQSKATQAPPDVLNEDEIRRLLKSCDGRSFEDRRDLAIMRILLDSGIRRAELAGLTVDNVSFLQGGGGELTVMGKGRKGAPRPFRCADSAGS